MTYTRNYNRAYDALRDIKLTPGYAKFAEGSCLVEMGDTHVLCTATVEDKVPPFMRNSGKGWITAEYGMLPRCSPQRIDREASKGKQGGRTVEIQRLIGRALRAVVITEAMGERQLRIDCDVLRADGGTRTASITGAYVALHQAFQKMVDNGIYNSLPILEPVAAVSCGLVRNTALLDIEYLEDSDAQADSNFIITESGKIVEIQAASEQNPIDEDEFNQLFALAKKGCAELIQIQKQTLGIN